MKNSIEFQRNNRLISNTNKFHAEINSNKKFSNGKDNIGSFIGSNPNIITKLNK